MFDAYRQALRAPGAKAFYLAAGWAGPMWASR
jgi:hypothetical protein